MVQLDLGERFDVVTCLFSSIGYVRDPPRSCVRSRPWPRTWSRAAC